MGAKVFNRKKKSRLAPTCHLCGAGGLRRLGKVGRGPSTTSDGRVWPHASVIWLCPDCRTLQKNPDAVTRMRIRRLYATYKPHYLSSGVEQVVFAKGRAPEARTARAFRLMRQHLPGKGRVLDFGTGNGAALKSFLQRFPRWTGDAYDVSRHKQREVLKIPRVRAFFSSAEDLPENRYEAVILWHTLEHIFHPRAVLDAIRTLLRPGGLLLLQVPDLLRNPFDLGIYDHVSHFTRRSLLHLMAGWGWKLEIDGMDWFHNTLTFGFSPSGQSGRLPSEAKPKRPFQELGKLLSRFKKKKQTPHTIFGTAQGALLVYAQGGRKPLAFLDEDPNRWGKYLLGVPVLSPSHRPAGSILFPFSRAKAGEIRRRIFSAAKKADSQKSGTI